MLIALSSCYEQDVEEPISTDTYPTATFTTDFTGNQITEGETINYTITLDRMLDHDITFTIHYSGDADEADFSFNEVTIPAYSKEGQMTITFTEDNFPEVAEAVNLEFGIFNLETQYTLNPNTVFPNLDLTIVNKNVDTGVTVAFAFTDPEHHLDFDLFLIHETEGDWGLAGTGDNPEIMPGVIATDDVDGKYFVTVDPYDVSEEMVDYTVAVGYPDQSVEFYTATFDYVNRDTAYDIVYFEYWEVDSYKLLTIEKTGSSYTVTQP
jgi:hypothetical protein